MSGRRHLLRSRPCARAARALASGVAAFIPLWFLSVGAASAQGVIAYPAQGQTADQQKRDRYECHQWAVEQSGFDPTQQQAAPPPAAPPPQVTTSPLRGAARGAAIGAVGGAIGGNAGKGAAIGAGTGALIGGIRRNDQIRQQQAYQQQYAAQSGTSTAQRSTYERAIRACLQGRGYTVN